jgi:hypothetical protein
MFQVRLHGHRAAGMTRPSAGDNAYRHVALCHLEPEWNACDSFTGWVNVTLNDDSEG